MRSAASSLFLAALVGCCLGCSTSRPRLAPQPAAPLPSPPQPTVVPAAFQQEALPPQPLLHAAVPEFVALAPPLAFPELASLGELEVWALENNPTLQRLTYEASAEWSKLGYANKLPDPTIGTMFFANAMNFVPDRQLAEVQIGQMIPWLGRLRAESRRAYFEALAADTLLQSERLRIIGDLRAAWFKLYVLGKQLETTEADQGQLRSLIDTASARIATGAAQPGDVLLATLELSSLQEQLLNYRQQVAGTMAELNKLLGRDARVPLAVPREIEAALPAWNHDLLREVAFQAQPELNAARLRTAATRWGIEVARLQRRPDLTFGAGWMVMAADAGDVAPGAGDDAWTLNLMASVPLWHNAYDAMLAEASQRHRAAHATEDEVAQRTEALLRDLWEQARAAAQTIELYEQTILPQARQTFEADQKSLVNGAVAFDRVIRDFRTILSLQLGYHRALGQLATTLARIRQTVGVDLLENPTPPAGEPGHPEHGHRQ